MYVVVHNHFFDLVRTYARNIHLYFVKKALEIDLTKKTTVEKTNKPVYKAYIYTHNDS